MGDLAVSHRQAIILYGPKQPGLGLKSTLLLARVPCDNPRDHGQRARIMKTHRPGISVSAVCTAAMLCAASMDAHAQSGTLEAFAGERLGTVSFEISCDPSVSARFNRAVALLHDFWYEESRPGIRKFRHGSRMPAARLMKPSS